MRAVPETYKVLLLLFNWFIFGVQALKFLALAQYMDCDVMAKYWQDIE